MMLCELGDIAKALIVDCVLGHLPNLLKERGFEADYLGIDLRQEMVARTRMHHAEAPFELANFLENKPEFEGHDFVWASGVLQRREAPLREQFISRMYELCGTTMAFSCLFT